MTKHKEGCLRVFNNYDMTCERCRELAAGSAPREGWQKEYFGRKQHQDELRRREIREHDCKKSGCGPVCTAFDW